jgi:Cytidylate kinase-like family
VALISVSGEPGCRPEELARLTASKLGCDLLTEPSLAEMIAREVGGTQFIPDRAWPFLVTSIVAGLLAQGHIVITANGSELLFRKFPGVLRVRVVAPAARRVGDLMVDRRLDRATAKQALKELMAADITVRTKRFGRATSRIEDFDLVLNAEAFTPDQMVDLVESAVIRKGMFESGTLTAEAEAQVQFQARLKLAKFGLTPPHRAHISKREFGHPSEEIFANLLDFYRIAWEYEPRSFPLQWDKDGKVLEAFKPDFYLPEFDLFVELTTMKQTLVTRKNRKIRLLRAIYPHVNIQVFYQKDLQDLIMKYGIAGKAGA